MSLATTCPTCSTVFRVVEEQLQVSEGWVRCGQCQQVFNALEGLFDLSAPRTRPGPLTWAPTQPVGFEHDPAPAPQTAADAPQAGGSPDAAGLPGDSPASDRAGYGSEPLPSTGASGAEALRSSTAASREFFDPETRHGMPDDMLPAGARFVDSQAPQPIPGDPLFDGSRLGEGQGLAGAAAQDSTADEEGLTTRWAGLGDAAIAADAPPEPAALPAFVRAAERRERWQRPGVRLALRSAALLLTGLLAGQAMMHWRDRLAASQPALKPLLSLACSLAGCELQPPRVPEALVVDNASVAHLPGSDAYRLTVQLRNRADYAVAAPYLDLHLTDGQGQAVLRRVLTPADFRVREGAIGAQSEAQWSLDFSSGQRRFSSYAVAAFYP